MAIACAYCGGHHDRPADVRACWERADRPVDDEGHRGEPPRDEFVGSYPPGPARAPERTTSPTAPRIVRPTPVRGAAPPMPGPDALGRGIVVRVGGDPPPPWSTCDRVRVDGVALADPSAVLARLRTAAHDGERVVIELDDAVDGELGDPTEPPAPVVHGDPHGLGPTFSFAVEELHHLVWSNAVDGRDPAHPSWRLLDQAIAAGARPVAAGDPGDVEVPGGGAVWLDGGPVRYVAPIDGTPVLHAVAAERAAWATPRSNDTVADLAPDQLAAVTHEGGGARIIAPAGSGKTRVLTERARHLLTQWRLPSSAVSLVAFNKRAQQEMEERTADLPGLHVRTLNSIALAIVNGSPPFAPQPRTWRTIDEGEVRRIIGDLVRFPRRRNSDPIAPWIEALSVVRLGLRDPDDVEADGEGDIEGFAAMWPRYRATLDRLGAVDFDDQIFRALLVLLGDPGARQAAQAACRVMLVDEFQDLTPAHLLLVRLLAAPGGAVFGVGDDDQTIYGYNGADPAWLIDFAELFPGSGDHPLEVNYRCPAGIVAAVDCLLRHNRRRVRKTIRAASTDSGGWSVDGRADSVGASVAAVRTALDGGVAPSEIAVLARVNALLAPVQVALVGTGVGFAGGVGTEFVDRTAIGAVLAWLRLAVAGSGPLAEGDLREALRRPSRSFHPRIADWIAEQRSIVDLHRLATRLNKERDAERVAAFADDIHSMQRRVAAGGTTSDVVLALIDEIGLAGAVTSLDSTRRGMNRASQGDDLAAAVQLAALHDDPSTFESWLRSQLAVRRDPDGVVLSTVHRVKGQEWPHVVVHHAADDQYPHRLADDVEEERRLFHVALTRASVQATIVTGPRPSPFVAELTEPPSPDREAVVAHGERSTKSARGSASRGGASANDAPAALDPDARRRYEALRELRNELRDGKPAYVVFDNRTLETIARVAPTSRSELARISGVGPAKLERYGDAVIALLQSMLA